MSTSVHDSQIPLIVLEDGSLPPKIVIVDGKSYEASGSYDRSLVINTSELPAPEWYALPDGEKRVARGKIESILKLDDTLGRKYAFPATFPKYTTLTAPDFQLVCYLADTKLHVAVCALFREEHAVLEQALLGQTMQVTSQSFKTPRGLLTNGSLEILTGAWQGRSYAPRKLDQY